MELLLDLVAEFLSLVLILLAGFIISYLRQEKSDRQFEILKDIVEDGVLFAHQVYW